MAFGEVTGSTVQELAELQWEYEHSPKFEQEGVPFEEAYCLTRIGKQPEDYDGPDRWCSNRAGRGEDGEHHPSCRFHGGSNGGDVDNLEIYAALKHGMYALPETIRETLSEEENAVLDDVLEWPEIYEIDLDEDPAAGHTFDTMAIEIVRQFRTSLYILQEYEVTTQGVYAASGERLMDETGNPVSEDVPNSLISAHQTQIRLIESMKDSLGVSRKARKANEQAEDRTDSIDGLSQALGGLIKSGEGSYDPSQFDAED